MIIHSTPEQANNIDPKLESIYRCPSDNIAQRIAFMSDNNGNRGAYRYSYSMNILYGNKRYDPATNGLGGGTHRKITKVRSPVQKIIYIDESEKTVNNGEYNPTVLLINADDPGKDYTSIAARHELN